MVEEKGSIAASEPEAKATGEPEAKATGEPEALSHTPVDQNSLADLQPSYPAQKTATEKSVGSNPTTGKTLPRSHGHV